tara:strand:+ start:142 stop:957 length:816 start_codon:yes stop_codon:yes gene_type:complete
MKIIYCDGCSWTGGHDIDPKLEANGLTNVNHPDNDSYRLPRLYPYKLGQLFNAEIVNNGVAGSSNDGIVRRTLREVKNLLSEHRASDIYVVIGWTSPERKDFFYRDDDSAAWDTLYPVQDSYEHPDSDVQKFWEIYVQKYWNEEEYLERYIQQVLLLHLFLKEHNVKHLFFDAFYEASQSDTPNILNSMEIDDLILESGYDKMGHYYLTNYFDSLRQDLFMPTSFRNFLLQKGRVKFAENMFNRKDYHPTEKAQHLWAKKLSLIIRRDIDG